jgi:uncharacterized membrane protein YgcG
MMKSFKQYLKETPPTNWTNSTSTVPGFSSGAEAPVAGFDPFLFPGDEDLLDQGFQAPGETGQDRYNRFFGVIPVQRMTLDTKLDGESSIDDMVAASDKYVNMMDTRTLQRIRSNLSHFYENTDMKKKFNSFIEEAATKATKCPEGEYYCHTDKKCKKIPKGKSLGPGGWLRSTHSHSHNGNGNGNGSHNGNGNGNGNGGNGNGGGGNGGGGNGGGE